MPSIESMEFKLKGDFFYAAADTLLSLCACTIGYIWEIPPAKRCIWLTVRTHRFRDALPFRFVASRTSGLYYSAPADRCPPWRWLVDASRPLLTAWPHLANGEIHELWVRLEYEVPA